jgi:membrane fusion protein (multidrug efflux system)
MKKSPIIATVVLFTGLAAAGAGLAAFKYLSVRQAMADEDHGEPASAVKAVAAEMITWQPTADLVGTVIAARSIDVSNELPGSVRSIGFGSGAVVESGDVLISLDDSTMQADLSAAQAGVRVEEAGLEVARSREALAALELERLRSAADASAASRVELDRAESEFKQASAERERSAAQVELAAARVRQIQAQLEKMVIRAPFRGRAGLRNIHEGQFLAEGASIVSLEEVGDRIFLDFAIPQEYLAQVTSGTSVLAKGELLGPEPVRIEVVAVDASVNNATRNIRVRAVVENRDDRLRPGMFVQIEVPVGGPQHVLVVPSTAVRRTPYSDQVYVLVEGEQPGTRRAMQRMVRLGPAVGEQAVVREGLKPGELVAADGAFKLRDGALVAVAPESSPAPPAPGREAAMPSSGGPAGPAQEPLRKASDD